MKRTACILLFTGALVLPAFSQYPTLVAGIGLEPLVLPDASGNPALFWTFGAEGVFSLKTLLGEHCSLSLYGKVKGGLLIDEPLSGLDAEIVSAELGLDAGAGRLVLKTLFNSSFLGTMTEESMYHPEWEARYYFSAAPDGPNPYLAYSGFLRVRPESSLDVFAEGAAVGVEYRPSYFSEYAVALRARWENWYETPLVSAGGLPIDSFRNDFFGELVLKGGWVVGLFLDCDLDLIFSLRLSDASAYLTSLSSFIADSESAFSVSLLLSFDWSPVKTISIKVKPSVSYTAYIARPALSGGALLTASAYIFAALGSAEFDFSPEDHTHFFFKFEGEWRHSNDDALRSWRIITSVGLKFSFDFP